MLSSLYHTDEKQSGELLSRYHEMTRGSPLQFMPESTILPYSSATHITLTMGLNREVCQIYCLNHFKTHIRLPYVAGARDNWSTFCRFTQLFTLQLSLWLATRRRPGSAAARHAAIDQCNVDTSHQLSAWLTGRERSYLLDQQPMLAKK